VPRPDPADRTRPDRCPGVLSLHPAADGGLARVRLPGGRLTTSQLQVLLTAATELGDGGLELTSRANLQLRALRPGAEHDLSDRLHRAGLLPSLSHERVRNIVASPRTGLDPVSSYDVGPLVAEVDRRLRNSPALADLPGRFLFALDDGRGDTLTLNPDVAARAIPASTTAAFLLSGHDTGIRLPWPAVPALLIAAAEAFLAERQAQHSPAWRLAELPNGPTAVLTRLTAPRHRSSVTPDAAQTPADGNRPARVTGIPASQAGRDGQALIGVTELAETPSLATPIAGAAAGSEQGWTVGMGLWFRPDGAAAVELGVPLGRLSREQAALLISAGTATGVEVPGREVELRVTPWRSVVVPELAGDAAEWLARFVAAGFVVDPGSAWVGVTACAGRPGCASALADVRGDAARVMPKVAAGRSVHWAGCARRCGRPPDAVDVVATGNGYVVDGAAVDGTGDGAAGLAGAIDGARRAAR
jgi:precorrin-3B synthase